MNWFHVLLMTFVAWDSVSPLPPVLQSTVRRNEPCADCGRKPEASHAAAKYWTQMARRSCSVPALAAAGARRPVHVLFFFCSHWYSQCEVMTECCA